ncbi:MAG: hemolysin family protein [Clostridia bacterium]|nr:hemolysin family protein [Clostridia bacterium]
MDDTARSCLLVLFLVFCAAYFAVTETAFSSVSHNKIKLAADRGDSRAKKALAILDNFDMAVTTLLICTNIVHLAAASIVTVAVTRLWGLSAVTWSTIVTTVIVFFAGEMLPKSVAKKHSEKFTLSTAGLLAFLMKIFGPLAKLLTAIGQFAAKHTKGDTEASVTEDELYDLVEDLAEQGHIDEGRGDLIYSALIFAELTVDSILTPRVDLVAIDIDDDPSEIFEEIRNSNHSRIPVYEDTIDNIIGVLPLRHYMKTYLKSGQIPAVKPLIDRVHYAHQGTSLSELLPVMSKSKTSMCVVTDMYGGTLGIVTMEDILEELVGEIWDEDDEVSEPIVKVSDSIFIADADETVLDAFDFMDFEDPDEEEIDTNLLIGEWVLDQFEFMPKRGESFEYKNLLVTVASIEHNRILKVRIDLRSVEEEGGDD